tara:strand:- start:3625 stop:3915 length:291 start_codon:yes stop_codon:yes gene_type:complete
MIDREIFICSCHSLEHQYGFWYDEEDNEVYFEPHLCNSGTWYTRFWSRLKYVFGVKTRFGAWDEIIIKPEDAKEIIKYLTKVVDTETESVADRGRD